MTVIEIKTKMDAMSEVLEALIEANGLQCVLAEIREICYDKANTIAVARQDIAEAKAWLACGIRVNSAAQSVIR